MMILLGTGLENDFFYMTSRPQQKEKNHEWDYTTSSLKASAQPEK